MYLNCSLYLIACFKFSNSNEQLFHLIGAWRHEVMGTWGHWLHVFHWFHCFHWVHCFKIFLYSLILSIQASMINFNFLTWKINFISFMTNCVLYVKYQYVLLCNLFYYVLFSLTLHNFQFKKIINLFSFLFI